MKHFPSNKLIIPFFLIGLSVLAVYFSSARGGPTKIYDKQTASLQVQKEAVENPNLDSDNDGLPDWQEILWKTDPRNPDTDGDKTPDGEEIKQNRNPLVKGPDDGILETMLNGDNKEKNPDFQIPDTFTDTIGQQFLTQLLINKRASGGKITTEQADDIANSMLSTMDQYAKPGEDAYKTANLRTVPATAENLKLYGNSFGSIIQKYFKLLPRDAPQILGDALLTDEQDSSKLEGLAALSSAYENTAEEAVKIEVPETFANDHLAVVNNFHQISKEINMMQKAFTDPALTLIAVKQYRLDSKTAHESLKNISIYFSDNNIAFSKEEGGNVFSFYNFRLPNKS